MNPNVPTYFYSQSSFEFWSDLTNWITVLNSDPKPPLVHSVSYGEQAEHTVSASYKDRFNTEMQKLGGRGFFFNNLLSVFLTSSLVQELPSSLPVVTLDADVSCAFASHLLSLPPLRNFGKQVFFFGGS